MKTAPTILTLLLLFRALHADSAEFVIDPNDILPKFDEPHWTAVEYSAIPKRTEMVVRTSSEDVVRAFWAKHSNRYDAKKRSVLSSAGAHFRRMLMNERHLDQQIGVEVRFVDEALEIAHQIENHGWILADLRHLNEPIQ